MSAEKSLMRHFSAHSERKQAPPAWCTMTRNFISRRTSEIFTLCVFLFPICTVCVDSHRCAEDSRGHGVWQQLCLQEGPRGCHRQDRWQLPFSPAGAFVVGVFVLCRSLLHLAVLVAALLVRSVAHGVLTRPDHRRAARVAEERRLRHTCRLRRRGQGAVALVCGRSWVRTVPVVAETCCVMHSGCTNGQAFGELGMTPEAKALVTIFFGQTVSGHAGLGWVVVNSRQRPRPFGLLLRALL
jgi:hypothetical protein